MKFEDVKPGKLFECLNYQIDGNPVQGLKLTDGRYARLDNGTVEGMMPGVFVTELWAHDPHDHDVSLN